MASSLKELVKKKILADMVQSIQPPGKWKILVVDPWSLTILNSVCRLNEVLDENVTCMPKRQPFYQQEAIYFVTPTEASIQALIADFSRPKPMYAAAHIFTTSSLPDALFSLIKKSPALQFVKTLKEISVDFIAIEQQAFLFDMPQNFFTIYNSISQSGVADDLSIIAKKIISVFSTLSEAPNIRYFDPAQLKVNRSYKLANAIQVELDALQADDPDFPPKGDGIGCNSKGTLIIVERSFDMVAPLLHEFTYQAMLNDLLVLKNGKYSFKLEEDEEKKVGSAALDENDPIWRLIRHWHFAEAVEYIGETFNRFLSSNKAAAAAMGTNEGPKGIESLNEMKDTLSSLPEFQEMKAKFSLHINICQECKTVFEQRNIAAISGIEQDLATGETSEGKPIKGTMQGMVPILYDPTVPSVDKLRLLMLYIICQDGINDADRRKLLEYAKLSFDECQAITNLSALGLRLVPLTDAKDRKAALEFRGPYTYKGKKGDKRRGKNEDMPYDLSRYVPLLKLVMEDQMTDKISTAYFPFIKDPPVDQYSKKHTATSNIAQPKSGATQPSLVNGILVGTGNNPYSLRTLRATWSTNGGKKKNSDSTGGNSENSQTTSHAENNNQDSQMLKEYRRNGPRVMVFVLGGMTYSEMRSSYEVMKEYHREVVIGSTHISNPGSFVEALKELHKASTDIYKSTSRAPSEANSRAASATPNKDSNGIAKDNSAASEKLKDKGSKFGIFKKDASSKK